VNKCPNCMRAGLARAARDELQGPAPATGCNPIGSRPTQALVGGRPPSLSEPASSDRTFQRIQAVDANMFTPTCASQEHARERSENGNVIDAYRQPRDASARAVPSICCFLMLNLLGSRTLLDRSKAAHGGRERAWRLAAQRRARATWPQCARRATYYISSIAHVLPGAFTVRLMMHRRHAGRMRVALEQASADPRSAKAGPCRRLARI
jgi:hypothetical protein